MATTTVSQGSRLVPVEFNPGSTSGISEHDNRDARANEEEEEERSESQVLRTSGRRIVFRSYDSHDRSRCSSARAPAKAEFELTDAALE